MKHEHGVEMMKPILKNPNMLIKVSPFCVVSLSSILPQYAKCQKMNNVPVLRGKKMKVVAMAPAAADKTNWELDQQKYMSIYKKINILSGFCGDVSVVHLSSYLSY